MSATETVPAVPASPEGMRARVRRLGVNSGVYLGGTMLAQGLAVLLFPLYTRYLTPADYGIIGVSATVLAAVRVLIGFGVASAVERLYFEAQSEEQRRRLYGTTLVFIALGPGALALGLHILGKTGALDLFPSVPYVPYLQYAIGAAYLTRFMDLPVNVFQARQKPKWVLFFTGVNALLIAGLTIFFVVGLGQGALGALRAWLVAAGIMAVIAIVIVARMASFRLSRRWLLIGLAFGLPLIAHSLGHWVLQLSDKLLLAQYVTAAELGLYTLGAAVGGAAMFLAYAMARAFQPQLILSLKREDEKEQVPLLGTYWVLALTWAMTAIALFATEAVVLLAPSRFHGAVDVIPWIVAGYLGFGLYLVVWQGTWFSMRTRMVPVVMLIAGVANVGMNLVLIPIYGIIGAAIATFAAYLLLALLQGLLSQRLYRIPWELRRWGIILLGGGTAFAFGSLVDPGSTLERIGVKGLAVVAVFPGVLTLCGFWRPRELIFMRRSARELRGRVAAFAKRLSWASQESSSGG